MFSRRIFSGTGLSLSKRAVTRSTIPSSAFDVKAPVYSMTLTRHFFGLGKSMSSESLFDLQKAKTDYERIEKLKLMAISTPSQAAMILHSGIIEGKFVGNEYIRQYVSALSKSGQLDKVDIDSLLGVLSKAKGGNLDVKSLLSRSASETASTGGLGGLGQGNGTSASNPLYVMNMAGNPSMKSKVPELLLKFIMMLIIMSIIYELLSEATGGAGAIGKMSKSAVHKAEKSDKRFADVLGIDEAKNELQEIVMYLKDPTKFTRLGGKLPSGVLLTGPPGTGKTLLARAIAGEADVPFFYSSGSEFEEMFVGVGAKRVRELFKEAKTHSPCIIFIDEIDAIGGKRNEKDQSTHRMTLNQLLVEMDGFEKNSGIIIVAATNFPESLDPALVRPGRFDKQVSIPTPDIKGRKEILKHYVNKIISGPDVDLEQLARGTPGYSGAELENLVNQAAVYAAVEELKYVTMEAFEHAKDKIAMGPERKSAVLSQSTMKCTAYHEAGHALVSLLTDGADPVQKATIMPRGKALGYVMPIPEGDQVSRSLKQMYARLDVCYGGRVAEELFLGKENVTSGAVSDIQQATSLAKNLVMKYGLSEKIGPVLVDEQASGNLKNEVDNEVKRLLEESYIRVKTLMEKNKHSMELIANSLLEHETLSGKELSDIVNGIKVDFNGHRSQGPSRPIKEIPPYERKKRSNPDKILPKSGGIGGGLPSPAPVSRIAAPPSTNSNSNSEIFLSPPIVAPIKVPSRLPSSPAPSQSPSFVKPLPPPSGSGAPLSSASSSSSINGASNNNTNSSTTKTSTDAPAVINDNNSSSTSRIKGPPKL
jgi:ATP-dependent metalloprotease